MPKAFVDLLAGKFVGKVVVRYYAFNRKKKGLQSAAYGGLQALAFSGDESCERKRVTAARLRLAAVKR
ncbi:hypothetical protein QJ48_02870 [Paenibacillus sp. A3]|nr:hypothetical protein QJ48_02870 [Paenibacillus sp. A3]